MVSKIAKVLLATVLLTSALSAEASLMVRMVQLAHRHGARGPLVAENATQVCGTEYPCGELTGVGIDMLNSVGRFVRARYNNLSIVEEELFPSTRYNSSVVYTRSTGIQRTIQSATAFLRGLFPEGYFYPVVYSHNITTDTLLNTDPQPSVMGRRNLEPAVQNAALVPTLDAYLTWDELQEASKEAYIEGLCQDYANRGDCAHKLYDIATSFEAAGRLPAAPHLAAALPGLHEFEAAWYRYVFGYNKSVELDRIQGAPSQNLAQMMLANINAHKLSPSFKLYEFSTHDTMMSPLAITFGDQTEFTMRPSYGVTIIVELLQDTDDSSAWYVRLLRGTPAALDNGSYEFQLNPLEVHCIDGAGNMYLASTGICPLENFRRMVDYSRPSVANGQCQMSQAQFDTMGCPSSIADGKPVPMKYCWVYRHVCSESACPSGYVLGRTDYQCYPVGEVATTTTTSAPPLETTTDAPADTTTSTTTAAPVVTTSTPPPGTTTTTAAPQPTTTAAPQTTTTPPPGTTTTSTTELPFLRSPVVRTLNA